MKWLFLNSDSQNLIFRKKSKVQIICENQNDKNIFKNCLNDQEQNVHLFSFSNFILMIWNLLQKKYIYISI